MKGEAIEVSSFIRYFPEGKRGDTHIAFVQGIIGEAVSIFLIGRNETVPVRMEECTLISPVEVEGGLVGLIAHHEKFGAGEIVDEERIDNLLWVKLLGHSGKVSEPIPISQISLCCACS